MSNATIQEIVAGLISLITILGVLAITIFQVVNGKPLDIPQYITLLVGAIVGAYFTHTATTNGARTAGTSAAQTAMMIGEAQGTVKTNGTSPTPTTASVG
jgi:hypothetical protein